MALDLWLNRPGGALSEDARAVRALAALLGRDLAAVTRKIGNLKSVDPEYLARGRRGLPRRNRLDEPAFRTWVSQPRDELRAEAARLRTVWGQTVTESMKPFDATSGVNAYDALAKMSPSERGEWIRRRREALQGRDARDETTASRVVETRLGQGEFSEGVLGVYVHHVGAEAARGCPGCGHARLKANATPLLEAHHIVPFWATKSMSLGHGLPLCPNCHSLVEVGPLEARRAIYDHARRIFPAFFRELETSAAGGHIPRAFVTKLRVEGALPARVT